MTQSRRRAPQEPHMRNRLGTPNEYVRFARLDEMAVYRGSDDTKLGHQLGELDGVQRLGAVRECVVGIIMDFDKQAVGACRDSGPSHWRDFVTASRPVRGIGDNRQVRELFDYRNGGDIERVAEVIFERADAALAEDDVVISAGENVFGAEEKLFDGSGHAPLEENGLLRFAQRTK